MKQTEAQFQAAVIRAAHLAGWHVAHFRKVKDHTGRWRTPVAADGAGFVDLVLARERILFRELKVDGNTLGPDQLVWRDRIRDANGDWSVWRPEDWTRIELELGVRRPA